MLNINGLNNGKANLLWKILFFRLHMRVLVIALSFIATLCSLLMPYYQKEFFDILLNPPSKTGESILFFLTMAFLFALFAQIIAFFVKIISYFEGSNIQHKLSKVTYDITMKIKGDSKTKMTVGQSLSVYATDVYTASTLVDDVFPNVISYVLPIVLAPIVIIYMTSINTTTIFLFMFSVLFINSLMALRQGKFFYQNKLFASIRVGYVNEWLQNMRVIRMLGWLTSLELKIRQSRIKETNNRLTMVTNGTTMSAIGYSAPFFINILAVFLLIKLEGSNITAGQVFSLLWIFGVLLTRPMRMLPIMLVSISDCFTSIKRIENYWAQEIEPEESNLLQNNYINKGCKIQIKGLNYVLNGKILLDNIDLDIKENEFVAIIGEIGSGKTLLIQALLNLIDAKFEKYEVNYNSTFSMNINEIRAFFSYVPQDFFIINSNLRDNVAFEYNFSKVSDSKIKNALELAQFYFDEENMKNGLDTEIGERGVNLSGGQKQRVAIARACYADRAIVLLDDCLSALDINTEEKLNEILLSGVWKSKTRILVTHRLSILPKCDRVLFIKNGKIVENGTFNEIYKRSEYVRDFVSSISIQE